MKKHSEVIDEIATPAGEVWAFFGWRMEKDRLRQMTELGALPGTVNWTGDQPGATRTISMSDGNPVVEQLVELNEINFSYRYRIIDPGPLPVSEYLGQVNIRPTGPDTCTIKFSAEFNEETYESMYQAFCRGALEAMKAILNHT